MRLYAVNLLIICCAFLLCEVRQIDGQLFRNERISNDTSYLAEIQDRLFKIQNNITLLNIAVMSKAKTSELQRRIAAIENEFKAVKAMDDERNEELANEISKCDESAIGFLRLFYNSLDAQIEEWKQTIRKKAQKEQDKILMPAILNDIKSKYFEEAEKNLIRMDNRDKTELIIYDLYRHNMSNFHSILLFAKELSNNTITDYIITGLMNELKTNVHLSPMNLMEIIKVLKYKRDLPELKQLVEQELQTISGEKFKAAIVSGRFRGNEEISNLSNILYLFNSTLFMDTMYRVVDEVYPRVSKTRLVMFTSEHVSQMVEVMVYIYMKLKISGDHDDMAMFAIADHFRKLSNMEHFSSATDNDKILVKNTINDFPSSLRSLYFSGKFSFVNVAYAEYMFAGTDFIHNDKRHVLTSAFGGKLSYRAWNSVKYRNSFANEFIFSIHSTEYLYTSSTEFNPENLFVTTSGYDGDARIFQLELKNNFISIKNRKQNRYLCATSMLYKEGKQYVFAAKYGHSAMPACQWRIVDA